MVNEDGFTNLVFNGSKSQDSEAVEHLSSDAVLCEGRAIVTEGLMNIWEANRIVERVNNGDVIELSTQKVLLLMQTCDKYNIKSEFHVEVKGENATIKK